MDAAAKRGKSNFRIQVGPFFADVVVDSGVNSPVYHWIVQREGAPEIVQWGQDSTLAAAESAATSFLNDLAGRERKRG